MFLKRNNIGDFKGQYWRFLRRICGDACQGWIEVLTRLGITLLHRQKLSLENSHNTSQGASIQRDVLINFNFAEPCPNVGITPP